MSHFNLTAFVLFALASSTMAIAQQPKAQKSPFPVPMNMLARQEPMADPNPAPVATESMTIVDIAAANPALSTFSKAIKAADLTKTLQGAGPFTIFAPNDMAFAKLSPNVLSDLLSPAYKDKLNAILTYHVIPDKILAADLKAGPVETVNGNNLDVKIKDGNIAINNAKVIKSDLVGSNGVIYIIDTVLMP